jgi:hypothetical protein
MKGSRGEIDGDGAEYHFMGVYLPDNTIGPLAELLRYIVSLIHDKVLVEDFKHLSSLQIGHDCSSFSLKSIVTRKVVYE